MYLGGNRLFISKDYGSTWTRTKDLTRSINRDTLEMMGVVNRDIKLSRNDGDNISEISNFAESPLDPKILWVGTDDGNVQLTTDGGATWTELSGAIAGVKNGTFVEQDRRVRRSRGTAYVSFDAHRDGDFAPYIFRTADFGKTWTPVDRRTAGRRRVRAQPGRVSGTAERALRRHRARALRHARQRRALVTARGQPADDALRRHPRPSADEGSGARHARPRHLDPRRRVADCGVDAGHLVEALASVSRCRAATLMLYWEDVSNMDHYFFTAENPAEGATFTYSPGAAGAEGAADRDRSDRQDDP